MWRKNRHPNTGSLCVGVDLNRNFDDHWAVESSPNPCFEDYHGPSAASEPETQAISNFYLGISGSKDAILSLSYHSYAWEYLYPYGYAKGAAPANDVEIVS